MDRFSRRRSSSPAWVRMLPDPFVLQDVLDLVENERIPAALSWLYAAIEGGRVMPLQARSELQYRFIGERREDDQPPETTSAAGGRSPGT